MGRRAFLSRRWPSSLCSSPASDSGPPPRRWRRRSRSACRSTASPTPTTCPTSLYAGALIVPGDDAAALVLRAEPGRRRRQPRGRAAGRHRHRQRDDLARSRSARPPAAAPARPSPSRPRAPCRSLISGVGLAAGGVVRVDVRLEARVLDQRRRPRRARSARSTCGVTLTSTDVAAPSGCSAVTPPTGGGTGGGGPVAATAATRRRPARSTPPSSPAPPTARCPATPHENACYVGDDGDRRRDAGLVPRTGRRRLPRRRRGDRPAQHRPVLPGIRRRGVDRPDGPRRYLRSMAAEQGPGGHLRTGGGVRMSTKRGRRRLTREHGLLYYIGVGLSFGLLAFVLLLASLVVVVPAVSGSTPYTILTSSMEPGLPPGTLVIVKPIEPDRHPDRHRHHLPARLRRARGGHPPRRRDPVARTCPAATRASSPRATRTRRPTPSRS